jgi:uncharacterized protein DUF4232
LPTCTAAGLRLSLGGRVSPETGEHAYRFVLTNRSTGPCVLDGYPRIGLYNDGHRLPFFYRRGRGHYASARRPQPVPLRPGSRAFFLVAKFRCDSGITGTASSIRVQVPNDTGALRLHLAGHSVGGPLDHCQPHPRERHHNTGNEVEISPISAAAAAVLPP